MLGALFSRLKVERFSHARELDADDPRRASLHAAMKAPHGSVGDTPGLARFPAGDVKRESFRLGDDSENIAPSADPVVATVAGAAGVDPALQGLAVLVAEDNALVQAMIAEQLTRLGCLPTVTGDGRQALAALAHAHFDVVLSDIDMPVMDGYELLAHLRDSHASLPVLAFSASTDSQRNGGWRECGFTGYIAKSVPPGELAAALLEVAPGRVRAAQADAVPPLP
jgi:two-component system capsular synthesis sensor histidine kinase RcsC